MFCRYCSSDGTCIAVSCKKIIDITIRLGKETENEEIGGMHCDGGLHEQNG